MNWEDERYVRVYVRDTVTWKLIGWQGRCLLPLLLRKADLAGCVDTDGAGAEGVAALVDAPIELVTPGLAALLARGVVQSRGDVLVFPKFMKAQEAKQSDKMRAQESRARRREQAMGEDAPESVTIRDAPVTKRDEMSRRVTDGHAASQRVTPSLAVLSRAEPSLPKNLNVPRVGVQMEISGGADFAGEPEAPAGNARKKSCATTAQVTLMATTLLGELSLARIRVDPKCEPLKARPANLEHLERLLTEGYTVAEIRHVIAVAEAEARQDPEASMRYFNAKTPFRLGNVEARIAMRVEHASKPKTGYGPASRPEQRTSSKTATVNEISGPEGLRRLGITVPEGAINRGPATESDRGNDRAF